MTRTLVTLAAAATLAAAFAADLGLTPPRQALFAAPGQTVTTTVTVLTTAATEQQIAAAPSDWTLGVAGELSYLPPGTLPTSASSWLSLEAAEFVLPPGGSRDLRIEVTVPANAEGTHHAMVFFTVVPPPTEGGGVGVTTTTRIGFTVYVTVTGTERSGSQLVDLYQPDAGTLAAVVVNTGNTVMRLGGVIELRNEAGDVVHRLPVTFTVTDDDLAAAQGCQGCVVVLPDPGPGVVFDVRRQNPNTLYFVDVSLTGWTPTGGPTLEVQATVTSTNGGTTYLQTDWLVVGASPTLVFDQSQANQSRVRVTLAYRLRLDGGETAGAFTTPVTYRIRGTSQTVSHSTQAALPTFLALRWVGAPASSDATLRFEYANAPMAFVQAVTTGAPLAPTSADFERLDVSTNHPSGYTVTVLVVPIDAPIGSASIATKLTLGGVAAESRSFTSAGPTQGYVTLAIPADFGLVVDGTETPGAYRVELRYEAVRNP